MKNRDGRAKIHIIIRFSVAVAFLALGFGHIAALPKFVTVYELLGTGQWLRVLVGVVYLSGGSALFLRRAYAVGAILLGFMMAGVTLVDVAIIDANPWPAVLLTLGCIGIVLLEAERPPVETPQEPAVGKIRVSSHDI